MEKFLTSNNLSELFPLPKDFQMENPEYTNQITKQHDSKMIHILRGLWYLNFQLSLEAHTVFLKISIFIHN